jgi:hypothetical protein
MAMKTNDYQDEFPEVQASVSRVALSLDSLLLNGISYGIIPRVGVNGFLEHVVGILQRDLTALDVQIAQAPAASHQPRIKETLAALEARCQQLINMLTHLRSYNTFSREHLCSTLSQIPLLRAECVKLIRELEGLFSIPKSVYQSRQPQLTASVEAFLANLEQLFVSEGVISKAEGPIGAVRDA